MKVVRTLVMNIKPFQIINAENTIMAKFSNWKVSWRLLAQSFLSSMICLSIISLNILTRFDVLWMMEVKTNLSREKEKKML